MMHSLKAGGHAVTQCLCWFSPGGGEGEMQACKKQTAQVSTHWWLEQHSAALCPTVSGLPVLLTALWFWLSVNTACTCSVLRRLPLAQEAQDGEQSAEEKQEEEDVIAAERDIERIKLYLATLAEAAGDVFEEQQDGGIDNEPRQVCP